MLKVTLVNSVIGAKPKQIATIKALGLHKLNSSVVKKDLPQFRGMIDRVQHLVKVEEAAE